MLCQPSGRQRRETGRPFSNITPRYLDLSTSPDLLCRGRAFVVRFTPVLMQLQRPSLLWIVEFVPTYVGNFSQLPVAFEHIG